MMNGLRFFDFRLLILWRLERFARASEHAAPAAAGEMCANNDLIIAKYSNAFPFLLEKNIEAPLDLSSVRIGLCNGTSSFHAVLTGVFAGADSGLC